MVYRAPGSFPSTIPPKRAVQLNKDVLTVHGEGRVIRKINTPHGVLWMVMLRSGNRVIISEGDIR